MNNTEELYIFKFKPFPQFLRFGGNKLYPRINLNKSLSRKKLAETWEISGHYKHSSIINNGFYKGKTLDELCYLFKEDLYGPGIVVNESNPFPLMLRLLDCQDDLPPAIHPDDKYCKSNNLDEKGKIEAWYIIENKPGSKVYCGFKNKLKRDEITKFDKNGAIFKKLKQYITNKGDVFLVPPKRPHSIGSGNLIYEIQQTSNAIFPFDWLDWDDKDHIRRNNDLNIAANLVDLQVGKPDKIKPLLISKKPNKHYLLTICKNFCLEKFEIKKDQFLPKIEPGFIFLTCITGKIEISSERNTDKMILTDLDTVLIPSIFKSIKIKHIINSTLITARIPRNISLLKKLLRENNYKISDIEQLGGYGSYNLLKNT